MNGFSRLRRSPWDGINPGASIVQHARAPHGTDPSSPAALPAALWLEADIGINTAVLRVATVGSSGNQTE